LIQKGFVRKLERLAGKAFPFQTYGTENEEYERDQRLNEITEHLNLPLGSELEQVLRYQTAMERQEARALTDLERLQRERAGEHVLPPVKVQLSTDASILLPECAAAPATVPIRHDQRKATDEGEAGKTDLLTKTPKSARKRSSTPPDKGGQFPKTESDSLGAPHTRRKHHAQGDKEYQGCRR
jgi:hypothetical protein